MGVQRAEPIDLSAGNEPFHINGGRGDRTQAQVFLVVCGCAAVAAGAELLPHTRQGFDGECQWLKHMSSGWTLGDICGILLQHAANSSGILKCNDNK